MCLYYIKMKIDAQTGRSLLICLILILVNLIAYEPMRHNGFVDYDDVDYVTTNPHVLKGITMDGVAWSFTETARTANWHPLTWLSHILDVELFGTKPFWHHFVSLLFHIANTLLLFWIFNKMTAAPWRSFFVAAIFAVHPLHVESVAWVAERKDVLSGFFWMLTIAAYVSYAASPNIRRYMLVILFFLLGLMAKPMLVTLPFVLLLLDFWPLERFGRGQQDEKGRLVKLLAEKIPLFLLSAMSSAVAFVIQKNAGAMIRGENYSLVTRASNACVAYISYIAKLFYPVNLAVLYPHPGDTLPLWQPTAGLALLIFMTVGALYLAFKRRFILMGWFWYLGTLVPVIGLVQIGSQAMADRYTYLPSIGIFIIFVWGVSDVCAKWKVKKVIIGLAASIILVALLIGTQKQLSYWQNSLTLFEHTLKITKNNFVIYNNYGCSLRNHGETDLAIENFNEALRIKPTYVAALNNLGMALRGKGKTDEAVIQWEKALATDPYNPNVNANLGLTLAIQGRYEEAIECFNKILGTNPDFPYIRYVLGNIYHKTGNFELAVENFKQAIKNNPDDVASINELGIVYGEQGRTDEAIQKWNESLAINPNSVNTHLNLAIAFTRKNQQYAAIEHYNAALQLEPNQPGVLIELCTVMRRQAIWTRQ